MSSRRPPNSDGDGVDADAVVNSAYRPIYLNDECGQHYLSNVMAYGDLMRPWTLE